MKFSTLIVALVVGMSGSAVMAQDNSAMSPDELKQLFEHQKTRGLVIAPNTDTGSGTATDTAASPADAAATYVELDKADQVNIQIRFDFDSAALREDQKPKLASLCEAMKSTDINLFRIVGHTDSSGTAEYNQKLSLLRAEEVKRHLVSECGIDPNRLEAVGVGEAFPFDKNDPRADANRRVEFQAVS